MHGWCRDPAVILIDAPPPPVIIVGGVSQPIEEVAAMVALQRRVGRERQHPVPAMNARERHIELAERGGILCPARIAAGELRRPGHGESQGQGPLVV